MQSNSESSNIVEKLKYDLIRLAEQTLQVQNYFDLKPVTENRNGIVERQSKSEMLTDLKNALHKLKSDNNNTDPPDNNNPSNIVEEGLRRDSANSEPFYSDISSPEDSLSEVIIESSSTKITTPPTIVQNGLPLVTTAHQTFSPKHNTVTQFLPWCRSIIRPAIPSVGIKKWRKVACTVCTRLICHTHMNYHMRIKHSIDLTVNNALPCHTILQSPLITSSSPLTNSSSTSFNGPCAIPTYSAASTSVNPAPVHHYSAPVTPNQFNANSLPLQQQTSFFAASTSVTPPVHSAPVTPNQFNDNTLQQTSFFHVPTTSSNYFLDVTSTAASSSNNVQPNATISDVVNAALMTSPSKYGFVKISCQFCLKLVTRSEYARHIRTVHGGLNSAASLLKSRIPWKDQYVRCKLCRKCYRFPDYNKHNRKVHQSIGCRYKCSICFAGFQSSKACKLHMTRMNHKSNIIVKSELVSEDFGETMETGNDGQCNNTSNNNNNNDNNNQSPQNVVNVEIKTEFDPDY